MSNYQNFVLSYIGFIDPIIIASVITILACIGIVTEALNRALVVIIGACLMILLGVITQEQAIAGLDFNKLFLLMGMMIIVGITEKSGIFQFMAIWSAKKVRADPKWLMVAIAFVTAIFSAFLDNVTTVLLAVPIVLLLAEKLHIRPYPYLLVAIFAANIGGSATLIGDPPNILIGSSAGFSFLDFIREVSVVSFFCLLVMLFLCNLFFQKDLRSSLRNRAKILLFKEKDSITDFELLKKSLFVIALVLIGFITAEHTYIPHGTIAMSGAGLLMFLYSFGRKKTMRDNRIDGAIHDINWTDIVFIAGLFVIVTGLEKSNVHNLVGYHILEFTNGNIFLLSMLIIWFAAFLSSFLNNIPSVTLMIPLIVFFSKELGDEQDIEPLWWALSLGTCLGGSATPIASSANIIALHMAHHQGHHPISSKRFMAWGIPIALISVTIASIYLYLRHFYN